MLQLFFLSQLIFIFPWFWGMVMYANEFKTQEKQKLSKITKIGRDIYILIFLHITAFTIFVRIIIVRIETVLNKVCCIMYSCVFAPAILTKQLQSQSKLLGHFTVFLPSQSWSKRFANFYCDKQHWERAGTSEKRKNSVHWKCPNYFCRRLTVGYYRSSQPVNQPQADSLTFRLCPHGS